MGASLLDRVNKWESHLHTSVPLSSQMGTKVSQLDQEKLVLHTPLKPNRNHHGTAFGGSLYSIAALCCWTWLKARLKEMGYETKIVVQNGTMDYRRPVTSDFDMVCEAPGAEAWGRFMEGLHRRGKARLDLEAYVPQAGEKACEFRGRFVAVLAKKT